LGKWSSLIGLVQIFCDRSTPKIEMSHSYQISS